MEKKKRKKQGIMVVIFIADPISASWQREWVRISLLKGIRECLHSGSCVKGLWLFVEVFVLLSVSQ